MMRAAGTPESKAFVLRWLALPSVDYVRRVYDSRSLWALPFLYARRALAHFSQPVDEGE